MLTYADVLQHMHFVVWDEPRRARLWRVDCGGARRPYALYLGGRDVTCARPPRMTLAFIRDKKLYVASPKVVCVCVCVCVREKERERERE